MALDYSAQEALRMHHPAWRLLRSDHAALLASFLHRVFIAPNAKTFGNQSMDENAFFWKIARNELAPPRCAQTLGIAFKHIDAEAGTIEAEFQGKPEFTNPAGNVQGGFLAAMLDDAMGMTLAATLNAGEFAPTLNLNVSFHRPASVGTLLGKGRIIRKGRDVCFLSAELFQEGQLIASATATAIVRPMRG